MSRPLVIRPATPSDRSNLRRAIIELQEYERLRHSTRLPGEQIADAYLVWIESRAAAGGAILIAERGGDFLGFIAGWVEETTSIAETADSNRFGYISDICVLPPVRGQRIATQLLDGMEQYLRAAGVRRLRIASLALNASARASYEHAGFIPYEVVYEKVIDDGGDA
jgi:ribosomal protein S18 acetylase RimI-like enzyme